MTLLGLTRTGRSTDPDAPWIIPSSLIPTTLQSLIHLLQKFEFDPPVYEDGKTAEDFLRSKPTSTAPRRSARKADFDDDDDDDDGDDERDRDADADDDGLSDDDRGEYAPDAPSRRL